VAKGEETAAVSKTSNCNQKPLMIGYRVTVRDSDKHVLKRFLQHLIGAELFNTPFNYQNSEGSLWGSDRNGNITACDISK